MARLRLFVLGPPRLERDGRPVEFGLRRALALLVYLALSRQPQSRDALATLLWPDSDQREARASLRRTLHRLTQIVGGPVLVTSDETVALDPGAGLWVDSERFLALAGSDGGLEEAAALYGDDFLAGFTLPDAPLFDEWQFFERERLRQRYAGALESLVARCEARGAWEGALDHARRWVALDELHEPAQRALMRAYALVGQSAAAVRQYQECARVLEEELGVPPEDETTGLYEAIRTRRFPPRPAPAPPAPTAQRPVADLHSPPLVGRDQECEQLAAALERVRAGQAQVVLIGGEPGIGKSRLAQAAADHGQRLGMRTIWQKCYQSEQTIPYQALVDLAGRLLAECPPELFRPLAPAAVAELAVLLPEIAEIAPGAGPPVAALAEARQARLFRALQQLLTAPAAAGPLLIVFDDIQWADPVSLHFLVHFVHQLSGAPVGLICTYRSSEAADDGQVAEAIHGLRRGPGATHLLLGRLGEGAVADLLAALPVAEHTGALAGWLHRETDGNPFFMISLLQSLREGGVITPAAPEWRVSLAPLAEGGDGLSLPDAVREAVRHRLGRLGPQARAVLDLAAVYGRQFDFAALRAFVRMPQGTLLDLVDGLAARQLLREGADGSYDFSHDKIREVVYLDLSRARRVLLHRQVAEALEAADPSRVGALAEQFEHGEDWPRAVRYLSLAAERARQLFALEEALGYLDRAVALAEQHEAAADHEALLGLYERRGAARGLVGGQAEAAVADLMRVLEAARAAGDHERERVLLTRVGQVYRTADRYEEAQAHLAEALAAARRGPDERWVADTLYHLGTIAWSQGRNDQALTYHGEAVAISRRLALDDLVAVQAFHGLGEAYFLAGRAAEAIDLYEESLALARRIQDKSYEAENLGNMGMALLCFGVADYGRARAACLRGIAISQAAHLELHTTQITAPLGLAHGLAGDYAAALAQLEQSLATAEAMGARRFQSLLLDMVGVLWLELGAPDRARAALRRAIALARSAGAGWWLTRIEADLALARLRLGEAGHEAPLRALLAEAVGRRQELHAARCLEALAEMALARGRPRQALAYAEQLVALAAPGRLREVEARARRLRGEALLTLARPGEAADELGRALALVVAIGNPRLELDVRAALVQLARTRDEPAAAAEHEDRRQAIAAALARQLEALLGDADSREQRPAGAAHEQGVAHVARAPLIGRDAELEQLGDLLGDPRVRLVTVSGPGGIGKTRLAVEAARSAADGFADGLAYVPLAPLAAPEHMVRAVADALGARLDEASDPRRQLLANLRERRALLLLDNFEHMLAGADLVGEILRAAPGVKVLVTSRERLQLSDEVVFALGGMGCPEESVESAAESPAVQLLLQRARMARPDFAPRPAELLAAARICRLVDGMPLAIILAASWVELLSLAEIADEIARSLNLLEGQLRDLPERQRSVRAIFESSWQRLGPAEQEAFARLSVFRGGFTWRAAGTVAGAGLPTLRALLNTSLIAAAGPERYEIHGLLRQYAHGRLIAAGRDTATHAAHSAHYLEGVARLEPDLKGRRQLGALAELDADFENVRAAWLWAVGRGDAARLGAAAESLYLFCEMRGRNRDGAELLAAAEGLAASRADPPEALWGRAAVRRALLQSRACESRAAIERDVEQALAAARRRADAAEVALCLLARGGAALDCGRDYLAGLNYFERSLDEYCELGDHFYVARLLRRIGLCQGMLSNLRSYSRLIQQSLAVARTHGNELESTYSLADLAVAAILSGDHAQSGRHAREAIDAAEAVGDRAIQIAARGILAIIAVLDGDHAAAEEQAARAQGLAAASGAGRPAGALVAASLLASLRGEYQEAGRLAEEARAALPGFLLVLLADWALSAAECGAGDLPAARARLRALSAGRAASMPGLVLLVAGVAAVILHREGDAGRAGALYAYLAQHPRAPLGWVRPWAGGLAFERAAPPAQGDAVLQALLQELSAPPDGRGEA